MVLSSTEHSEVNTWGQNLPSEPHTQIPSCLHEALDIKQMMELHMPKTNLWQRPQTCWPHSCPFSVLSGHPGLHPGSRLTLILRGIYPQSLGLPTIRSQPLPTPHLSAQASREERPSPALLLAS